MAKFKADMDYKDLEKDTTHRAGEEFEMTLKRADELVANIKKNHNVEIVLTRLDVDEEAKKEVKKDKEEAE